MSEKDQMLEPEEDKDVEAHQNAQNAEPIGQNAEPQLGQNARQDDDDVEGHMYAQNAEPQQNAMNSEPEQNA